MKEGWVYRKLGEVTKVQNGFAFDSKQFNEQGNGVPLIRIRDIKRGYSNTFTTEDCPEVFHIKDGDLLIGMDGDFNVCIWKGGKSFLNQRVCHVVPSSKILSRFLYYLLPFPLQRINDKTAYSTVKHLSSKQVLDIDIPVPSIEDQRRIVSRLDSAFSHIDELKAKAEKQLSEAKALFQKALAEEMKPKEGWNEKKLGEIANVFSGYAFKSSQFKKEGQYQVVRIGNIKQNYLRLAESIVYIDNVDNSVLKKSLLKIGDLVVTQTGTRHKRDYGFVARVNKEGLLLNQRNACIRFDDANWEMFFLYYSYTDFYKNQFFANEGGAVGQGNVSLGDIKALTISYPIKTEIERIVSRLDTLSTNIRKLEEIQRKTLAECDALKQALLREVFEGE